MTNLMKLVKIIDLYEDRVKENRKNKLSSFPITGSIPFGVLLLEDLVKEYIANPNFNWRETYVCAVKANSIYSSPVYNRPFEIDLNRCEKYVEEEGSFSYVLAGTGSGYVRPNGEFVSTQGGHRTTEAYAVSLNPEVRLLVNVKFHDPNSTDEQIIELEAKDHHVDAAKRNPQNTEHKFRSAYRSNEDWAVKLFNYLKPFDISVAGTLDERMQVVAASQSGDISAEAADSPVVAATLLELIKAQIQSLIDEQLTALSNISEPVALELLNND